MKRTMKTLLAPAALLALVTSCGGEAESAAPAPQTGPHPLDGYYLDAAPEGAIEVAALRGLEDGATVTVRGDVQEFAPVSGKAVLSLYDHADLGGFHGITHLSDVVVTGTLSLDDAGNAKIVASGLHVE